MEFSATNFSISIILLWTFAKPHRQKPPIFSDNTRNLCSHSPSWSNVRCFSSPRRWWLFLWEMRRMLPNGTSFSWWSPPHSSLCVFFRCFMKNINYLLGKRRVLCFRHWRTPRIHKNHCLTKKGSTSWKWKTSHCCGGNGRKILNKYCLGLNIIVYFTV